MTARRVPRPPRGIAAALAILTALVPPALADLVAAELPVGRVGPGPAGPDRGCTGALVAPDIVLTAAHCGGRSSFVLHGRGALAEATEPNPAYREGRPDHDIRIIRLAAAFDDPPLPIGAPPEPGEALRIVARRNDRIGPPVVSEPCYVLVVRQAVAVLDCHGVSGMSGAPVLRETPRGPEIAAVLVATSTGISYAALPDLWLLGALRR